MSDIALGFRVKSGYAIAIALEGGRDAPLPLKRVVVELSDARVKETRQPYHDGFGTAQEDPREIARRVKIVERCAKGSVASLIAQMQEKKTQVAHLRAALVVGSVIDPQQVANPHIRAHANEGRLFRRVLEDALRSHGIVCEVIVEKQLAPAATTALRRPDGEIKSTVAAFGKTLGGPWRADEKAAATAAWLALR